MMQYIKGTKDDVMTLSADSLHVIKWYIDTSFAVHPDFKSHTGAVMTMGEGAVQSASSKQKLNTRSTCKAELVGVDDNNRYVRTGKCGEQKLAKKRQKKAKKEKATALQQSPQTQKAVDQQLPSSKAKLALFCRY